MFKVAADIIARGSVFRSGMLPNLLVPRSEVPGFMDFCCLVGIDSCGLRLY